MSPDDDWALGQNEVDVRNEARKEEWRVRSARWVEMLSEPFFACRNPEQAWIDESRAEADRDE